MPKNRYQIWLEQAKYDLNASKYSLQAQTYEWSCYQAVQSVEKALKAVIVHSGWSPPQTHKLGVLVSISNKANNLFKDVKLNFRKLESYTFISRYPFVYPDQKNQTPHDIIQKNDALVCITIAEDLYSKVINFLNGKSPINDKVIDPKEYYFTADEVINRIDDVKTKLLSSKKLNISKIILFGSFAREKIRPKTSTMDILVVAETDLGFIDRIEHVREITRGHEPIIEPLVYTSTELDYMVNDQTEGFLESAINEGKVMYSA